MSRLPDLPYERMSDEQKRIHDEIAAGPRGAVFGPFKVWLHAPELADRAQKLGAYARYHSSLPPHLSELAILVTGAIWQADFEWYAHLGPARAAGIPEAVIEAIRLGETPPLEDAQSQAVYAVARAMHQDRRLSAALYDQAKAALGERGLVDLIGILGYYTLIAMTLNAFEVETPDGSRPLADRA